MEERIINLLKLCMAAQEKGNIIDFTKSQDHLSIWDLTDNKYFHYLVFDDATMDVAEAYIKGLINK